MKKKRTIKWLPIIAVPLSALALIAVVNVWRPDGNTPQVVQKVTEPLTAKQVFAAAANHYSDKEGLGTDEVQYLKFLHEYIGHDDKGRNDPKTPCTEIKGYTEVYTDSTGNEIMRRASNREGILYSSYRTTYGPDGQPMPMKPEQMLFDESIAARSNPQIICPIYDFADTVNKSQEGYDWQTATTEEDREDKAILGDLMSGVLPRQKYALQTLQNSKHYAVAQHQRIDYYPGEVIKLSKNENTYWYQAFFFDQSSKKFIGLQRHEQLEIIVEQLIKKNTEMPKL